MAVTCACASTEASLNACPVHGEHGSEVAVELFAELTKVTRERDELAARLYDAHDALTRIDDGDDDSFVTLETTVDYFVNRHRAVCESEANAADLIDSWRASSASQNAELKRVSDLAIDRLAEIDRLTAAALANRQVIVARDGGRYCLPCDQEIRRGEAYELVPGDDPDALKHVHCPDGLTVAESRRQLGLPTTTKGGSDA